MRIREARARKNLGRKIIRGKEYRYTYYTLPLNLYIPKHMIEKHGTEYIVEINEDEGVIKIYPKNRKYFTDLYESSKNK